MAVTDLPDVAAAVAAGYSKIQVDRAPSFTGAVNANLPARYATRFEKLLLGSGGQNGEFVVVEGESNVSFAAADAQALASLNARRRHSYGGSGGRASGDAESPDARGGTQIIDVT